jgi:hypothetical protein
MARGGALRGAVTAWLGLAALYAVADPRYDGSSRLIELANGVANFIDRALNPNVPAIPDLRAGETWGTSGGRNSWRPTGTYGDPSGRDTGRPGIGGVPLDAATRARHGQGI